MKIYVEMDELQFDNYKKSLEKPKELTDHASTDLAAALLNVIQKEGGKTDENETYDNVAVKFRKITAAKIRRDNFVISLIVEKYSDR